MADPLTVACSDCLAPIQTPCTSPLLQDGEVHTERQRLADLRNLTHGTCNLCHQPMVYGTVLTAPPDAWHPDPTDAAACPPMPNPATDWNAYASAINAGTQAGHPGIEHFTPDPHDDAAWDAQIDARPPALCPECASGKCPNCTTITLDPTLDDFTPCTCTHPETTP